MRTIYDSSSGLPTLFAGALGIAGLATIGWVLAHELGPDGAQPEERGSRVRTDDPTAPALETVRYADPFAPANSVAVVEIVERGAPVAASLAPPLPASLAIDAAPPLPSPPKEDGDEEDDDEPAASELVASATMSVLAGGASSVRTHDVETLVATRGRTSSANERARSIARTTALRHFAQDPSSSAHRSPSAVAERPTAVKGQTPMEAV